MLNKLFVIYLLSLWCTLSCAYTTDLRRPATASSRRAFIKTCTVVAPTVAMSSVITASPVGAFDGAGSSAYAGKSTTSKAELKKSYQQWVIADVKDFKTLGAAINDGETEGDAWVDFFIEYQRREPDSNGRAYAAFVDLVGNKELSGCGTLLAASFAKPGKPSEVSKSFRRMLPHLGAKCDCYGSQALKQ